ncbi:exo-beta-N-acetylmuramidase NamZ domain-containing protein [Bacillus kwashiorkori]|uniref:exo-beta-N-acetylmuramidase NamZ family protein n=1 Tax=Bacillus kwashiorkori TaxID=1522318 RepID=UPI000A60C130|nr:DUF1343 domain-containing protein [Bacillus kwashiorkori]
MKIVFGLNVVRQKFYQMMDESRDIMKLGFDIFLEKYIEKYKGKRIGLITNLTGVNQKLVPIIDIFYEHPEIHLTALYAPEHGIRGDAKEGEKVGFSVDERTGLPVYSLYGETRKPTAEMLEPVDVLVFDLQDIGARYYTFIYTMAYVMEACKEHQKEFVVLDRPNPVSGEKKEGNLLDDGIRSFVGLYPIPNRHGLTVGELAHIYKHEFHINCELTVVQMEGWSRSMYYDETSLFWVPPSPNTTGMDMCILYPGTCLVEGTNLSEGRGTTRPFEYIGAPYVDGFTLAKRFNENRLAGVIARPISFQPTYQKHNGVRCEGVQLHVSDREKIEPVKVGVTLLANIAELYPDDFEFISTDQKRYFFDLLAGTKQLREDILTGNLDGYFQKCATDIAKFEKFCSPYYLYK